MKIRRFILALAPLALLATALEGQAPGSELERLMASIKPGHPFIEEMTWTEIRDAMQGGSTTVIIPTGGTEKNGPHMSMGKHNYVVTAVAEVLAGKLGNALVAPTIKWVPEGNYDNPNFTPGVISHPGPHFLNIMEAAIRSMASHGFREIVLIGDNGGNQNGMREIAEKMNAEFASGGPKVYALTDYYDEGQNYIRVWLQAQGGYTMDEIGTHAGMTDTSAMMYVFPKGIREHLRLPLGGSPDQGVSGDPTKATIEIGRMVVDFKATASYLQYQTLTAPPRQGRGG